MPYLVECMSKGCFFTKSPRTDWMWTKMLKCPNAVQKKFWKLSWETSPSNLRFLWVELIPINLNYVYSRSCVICSTHTYIMKWMHQIPCIRDRRMALMIGAITFQCSDTGSMLAPGIAMTNCSMSRQNGCMGHLRAEGRWSTRWCPWHVWGATIFL